MAGSSVDQPAKTGLLTDFKNFIADGNLLVFAVGFIMGAATKDLMTSFVDNIFSGIIGLFFDCGADGECQAFGDMAWRSVRYGAFLNSVVTFLMLALVVFLLVRMYRKFVDASAFDGGPTEKDLLQEIRDALVEKN